MYSGLEVRVPFCDYRIAEYLYGVPWVFKDHRGKEKGLLRTAMEGILPDEVLWRKKSPYPKTYDPAYTKAMADRVHSLLAQKDAAVWNMVDRGQLQKYLQAETPWPWYGQLMRKPQTMAYILQLHFWIQQYKVQLV